MASEIRVDKITSLSGVGTITPSPTGIDIAGITTVATLKATTGIVTTLTATTGIVTTLTANTVTSLGAVSGTTGTFSGAVSGTTGTFSGAVSGTTGTFTSHVSLGDSDELRFGDATGGDLKIYHDGNNSAINDVGTGSLYIQGSDNIYIRDYDTSENHIVMTKNGSVDLYNDGGRKFNTESTGVRIYGAGSTFLKMGSEAGGTDTVFFDTEHSSNAKPNIDFRLDADLSFRMANDGDFHIVDGDLIFSTAGHGIDFSETSDASGATSELLDDYEEGSFTFVRKGFAGGFDSNYQLANQTGKYTKIGRQVLLKGGFNLTGNSGNIAASDYFTVTVGSLPFAPDDTSSGYSGAQIFHQGTWWAYTSLGGGSNAKGSVIEVSGDYLSFYCTSVTGSPVRNSNEITFTISYTST